MFAIFHLSENANIRRIICTQAFLLVFRARQDHTVSTTGESDASGSLGHRSWQYRDSLSSKNKQTSAIQEITVFSEIYYGFLIESNGSGF